MVTALLTKIGHTTATKARVMAVFDQKSTAVVRLSYRTAGGTPMTVDAASVDSAPPYVLVRFDLTGLSPGASIDYRVVGAATAAALPNPTTLFGPSGDVAGGTFRTLPAPTQRPPRIALVSCNGVHTAPENVRYRLWRALKQQIDGGNIDLIVFAGDQVYADPLWMKHDTQNTFGGVSAGAAREALTQEYREWTIKAWAPPDVRAVLSSCPSIMMWDDHDIYDGYGSNDDDQGASGQLYFAAAQKAFSELQASHNPPPLGPSSFAFAFDYGGVGFLVLDGRSNRDYGKGRILGEAQLRLIENQLQNWVPKKLDHLFVVAGVPIVHAPVGAALGAFSVWPRTVEAEDDLRDSWAAPNNLGETRRLLLDLFNFGKVSGTQVSVLSGDVHVATIAAIESSLPAHRGPTGYPARIHQIVSSGIGYMPPSGTAGWFIKQGIALSKGRIELAGNDIVGQLLPFQGSTDRYLFGKRNFAIVKISDAAGTALDSHRNVWIDYFCEEATEVVVREQCLMRSG